jgi:hypothetical protein
MLTILFSLVCRILWIIIKVIHIPLCRSQWPCGLRRGSWPVGYWDRGFESRLRHGCLSVSFCVVLFCVVEALRRADHSSKESYRMSK